MKPILISFSIFISLIVNAQQAKFLKINKYQIAVLSDSLNENSGLDFFEGKLFTFNDGENFSEIFQLDLRSGKIEKKISTKFTNNDWESLTNDGENFYIGDFGNNLGNRKDLKVLVRSIFNDYFKVINFNFPEQKEFNSKNKKTNFDGEAMVYFKGKLHLFTKEWSSNSTAHYTLDPKNFEFQNAEKVEVFTTDFMVTDASIYDDTLYLVGYSRVGDVYLQIFPNSRSDLFFNVNYKKYYLGNALNIGQIEGIAVNGNGIYLSGERFKTPISNLPPKLFFIPKEKLK